jgi:ComF family protein
VKNSKGRSRLVWLAGVAAESLFATLFPGDCRLCGSPLVNISRLPVCSDCLNAIAPVSGPTCVVCGERVFSVHALGEETRPGTAAPHESAGEAAAEDGRPTRCGMCRRMEQPYQQARAYGSYDGNLRGLIHLLKYEQVRPAAKVLGEMLAQAAAGLVAEWGSGLRVVIPVPLHSSRLRERGFNQAELIAREALDRVSGGAAADFQLRSGVLRRKRATESQTGLTRHQRRENIRGAFEVARPEEVAGREVLLVDDVFTTGTTVSECARVLRRAGAERVLVATVARVMKGEAAPVGAAEPQERAEVSQA